MADHGQAADRVQDLGHCRSHAGAFARRKDDRQQFSHELSPLRDFYRRAFSQIYGMQELANT